MNMKNKDIDLTNFKKIDAWHFDSYTEHYEISALNKRISYKIHKSKIFGNLRKGSYIAVTKGDGQKIISTQILTQAEFNKLQKERAA